MIGSEIERHRESGAKRSLGAFLLLLGLVQVALCAMTGGLASPYFLLLACTTVLAGLTLAATRAMYVTAILACAYVLAMRLTLEDPAADLGAASRTEADMITAVAVQVVFLLLAPALAARVASRQRDQMQALSVQSMRDPLTMLENRRSFLAKMEGEMLRAERFAWPITMLILDLDHFKKLNDEHGHAVGDAVLVEVGNLLRETVGPVDHLARVGGEEFAVAAVAAEPHHGRDLADRLVRAFRSRNLGRTKAGLKVTVSIGVAVLPPGRTFAEPTAVIREVMERADRALYRVKENGRDGFHVAAEGASSSAVLGGA
jgi:diguanylate cyclase (GGDEF)-like protein